MGFLDRLKQPGGIAVSTTVEPAEVAPGAEVLVRADVVGELDDKCRAVRVGITCTGHYLVKERDRDYDGDTRTREVWRTIDLHEQAMEFPATAGPQQAPFVVPPEASPASADAVERTAWARVDRDKGRDSSEEIPLPVRAALDPAAAGASADASNEGLTLQGVAGTVRAGDALNGTLVVALAEDIDVTAVRIRLHRRCTYVADRIEGMGFSGGQSLLADLVLGGSSSHIVNDEQVAEIDLAGKRSFAAAQSESLPFSVTVPAGGGPSTAHQHGQVDWRVEAVLDRRLRGDLSVQAPVTVV